MRKIGSLIILFFIGVLSFVGIKDWGELKKKSQPKYSEDVKFKKPSFTDNDHITNSIDSLKANNHIADSSDGLETNDYELAKKLFDQGKYKEALDQIKKHHDLIENENEMGAMWLHLYIDTATKLKDEPLLFLLYQYKPSNFALHEEAALQLAEIFTNTGQLVEYENIRAMFPNSESHKKDWMLLDVDNYLFEAKRKEAMETLESYRFEGKDDLERLIRLALLKIAEEPKKAWLILDEAYQIDPDNPQVLSYRGRLYEMANQHNLANQEYLKALANDKDNPEMIEQLADFYIRQKKYHKALDLMQSNLEKISEDSAFAKAIFWNRVITPINLINDGVPTSDKALYSHYLSNLKPWEFWNDLKFRKLPDNSQYLFSEQSTFWLKLLAAIKQGNEKRIQTILRDNPFSIQSWHPELEVLLKRISTYRTTGKFDPKVVDIQFKNTELESIDKMTKDMKEHPFFVEINEAYLSENSDEDFRPLPHLDALLRSDLAYLAAFLAAGWKEAALDLLGKRNIPDQTPEWIISAIADAYLSNRGSEYALNFIANKNSSANLKLKTAELMVQNRQLDDAVNLLEPYAKISDELGEEASLLLTKVHMEQGDLVEARLSVQRHPNLYTSVVGQELLARIAILEDNDEVASYYYEQVKDESDEAKSYLAKKAFIEKDWEKARQLTLELLNLYPNNKVLKENLEKIEMYLEQSP